MNKKLIIFGIPLIIIIIALVMKNNIYYIRWKKAIQTHNIPTEILKSGQTGDVVRFIRERKSEDRKKNGRLFNDLEKELSMLNSVPLKNIDKGWPIVSISVLEEDLYNQDTGIIFNAFKRGMKWERPGLLKYYHNKKVIFETGIGVRVHGGKSRNMEKKSFRLVFRNIYGDKEFKKGILFDGHADPIRTLIVHNDMRYKNYGNKVETWRFMNPIAYDLSRKIGCIAPRTKPVQFYLNGEYQGIYILTEHLSLNYLKAHFRHGEFTFAWTNRGDKTSSMFKMGDNRRYKDIIKWPKNEKQPFSVHKAKKMIDLENLTFWFLSIIYCGTTDPFQGAIVLDHEKLNSKWYWINLDMDHSFMDFYNKARNPWEIDIFDIVLNNPYDKHRSVILRRLFNESPEYVKYFKKTFLQKVINELSDDYILSRIKYYQLVAENFGLNDDLLFDRYKKYVFNRKKILMEQIEKYTG